MGDEVLQGILDVVLFRWEIFSSDGWSEGKPDLGWQMAVEEQVIVSFKCSTGTAVLLLQLTNSTMQEGLPTSILFWLPYRSIICPLSCFLNLFCSKSQQLSENSGG